MNRNTLNLIGNTPLVSLSRISEEHDFPILCKAEYLNPGGSVKDRIALAILDDAENRGLLKPGSTLIEATAGNTGLGLALVAAQRGYALVCVMPEKMSIDKKHALEAVGAKVIITSNVPLHDSKNFRNVARSMAVEKGWFLTDQFANPANPKVHYETTGPEIWNQCGGNIGAFVTGAGTGGTITGVGRFLKEKKHDVKIILADPIGSRLAHLVDVTQPDQDTAYQVEGIGGSEVPANLDLSVIDGVERVSDEESFAMTKRLWKEEGLLVGGSTGTNLVASLRVARSGTVKGPVITILADSWDRYFAKAWTK